jgi:hypothetical protein
MSRLEALLNARPRKSRFAQKRDFHEEFSKLPTVSALLAAQEQSSLHNPALDSPAFASPSVGTPVPNTPGLVSPRVGTPVPKTLAFASPSVGTPVPETPAAQQRARNVTPVKMVVEGGKILLRKTT